MENEMTSRDDCCIECVENNAHIFNTLYRVPVLSDEDDEDKDDSHDDNEGGKCINGTFFIKESLRVRFTVHQSI
jgi:hypothetical protein